MPRSCTISNHSNITCGFVYFTTILLVSIVFVSNSGSPRGTIPNGLRSIDCYFLYRLTQNDLKTTMSDFLQYYRYYQSDDNDFWCKCSQYLLQQLVKALNLKNQCWAQTSSQCERAWGTYCSQSGPVRLETSHTPLYHFAGCAGFLIP